jgi:hypothetical protein
VCDIAAIVYFGWHCGWHGGKSVVGNVPKKISENEKQRWKKYVTQL